MEQQEQSDSIPFSTALSVGLRSYYLTVEDKITKRCCAMEVVAKTLNGAKNRAVACFESSSQEVIVKEITKTEYSEHKFKDDWSYEKRFHLQLRIKLKKEIMEDWLESERTKIKEMVHLLNKIEAWSFKTAENEKNRPTLNKYKQRYGTSKRIFWQENSLVFYRPTYSWRGSFVD